MQLSRNQQDIVAPGAWLIAIAVLAFFALPFILPGAVIATLVLGIYYAARDADGAHRD